MYEYCKLWKTNLNNNNHQLHSVGQNKLNKNFEKKISKFPWNFLCTLLENTGSAK